MKSDGFNGFHSTTIVGQGNPSKMDIFKVASITGFLEKMAASIYDEVHAACCEIRLKGW